MLTFNVPGVPVPQGSKRVFRGRLVDHNSAKLKQWRSAIAMVAQLKHKGAVFEGPIHLTAEFRFPRPKSHYGTGKNATILKPDAPIFHTNKPDLDKLVRAVGDALTQSLVIKDDCKISRLTAVKIYGVPGVTITIEDDRPQMQTSALIAS